jgi:sulfite reductase (NADPH) flavoprotein alpha-component
MIPPRIKAKILTLHRWIALAIAPVILLVLLSGLVLAFRPILGPAPAPARPVEAAAVLAALAVVDPKGTATQLRVSPDGSRVDVETRTKESTSVVHVDLATQARLELGPPPFDVYDFATRAHRRLFVGLGTVVTIACYAMVALGLLGPFIAWPRRRNTVPGWHTGIGWFLFPLVLLGPVTGVLMDLHVGDAPRPPGGRRQPAITLAQGVEAAARAGVDLRALTTAQRGGRGVVISSAVGAAHLVAEGGAVSEVETEHSLARKLHEGTWGGAIAGVVSLLGGLAGTAMLGTGTFAWARRWLRQRAKGKSAPKGKPAAA